jgi:cholest-4-en-3-one 26-monooxygenase
MTVDSLTRTRPDVDLADGSFYAGDSRAAYAWMRTNEPVFRDRNGLAGAATYRAVIDAERNPELFSSAGGIRPDHVPAVPQMIDLDDPVHLRRRKLVNSGFTRKRVLNLGQSIGELCDALIDAICSRGECDFVWDLAAPLPMAVIGDMLGVRPDDRALLLKWSDDLVTNLSSHLSKEHQKIVMDAFIAYRGYTMELIEQRRSAPADDLVSALVHAEFDGDRLSDDDIIMDVLLILVGGDETTRHTLSGGTEQ